MLIGDDGDGVGDINAMTHVLLFHSDIPALLRCVIVMMLLFDRI